MTKTVSQKQLAANRRNAKKSTGPKTAAGKARSARNALRHGLLAKDVVVNLDNQPELQADFDALLADLCQELRPQGLIEETLVERVATCYWRLRRAQRFEVSAIRDVHKTPSEERRRLDRLKKKLEKASSRLAAEEYLVALLSKPEAELSPEEAAEIEDSLKTFENLYNFVDPDGAPPEPIKDIVRRNVSDIVARMQAKVEDLSDKIAAAEIAEGAKSPTVSLPETDSIVKLVRYETMLDRQLHRALAELRRLRRKPRRDADET